ncbi:hypothetical protein ACFQ34_25035 [Pseudonocardia benzenivorans]|uniref:Uncharacterized protein n=2 Tax=Pseudonocardia TaxID=1847 RepID=F4CXA7_PSEUX|nr:hypothetical protein [Pseudonocardia dioxanivorans]AEA25548.1 hypothetical protein Psed_3358 [Pseudonocardia dioxanivorans CB1190]GJF03758.1 hypothetical protein PSD17_27170 [Pseudonocardia sp. D17]
MSRASATLTVWASAWLAGAAAPDDVLDALAPWADAHDVLAADDAAAAATDLPGPGSPATSVTFLLAALRRAAPRGQARVVLPVAGDIRGLPGPGGFSDAALAAGEGVLFPDAGFGAVPSVVADGVLRWTVHAVPDPVPPAEHVPLNHAEFDLRDQVRRSASVLTSLGVARHRPGVREEIAAALRSRPRSLWPDGMPGQSLRVLQHADEVDAILAAASVDEPGGALSASAAGARRDALRPIEAAVRVARRAAVAEAVRVLATSPAV